jgi:hypothetical protein
MFLDAINEWVTYVVNITKYQASNNQFQFSKCRIPFQYRFSLKLSHTGRQHVSCVSKTKRKIFSILVLCGKNSLHGSAPNLRDKCIAYLLLLFHICIYVMCSCRQELQWIGPE